MGEVAYLSLTKPVRGLATVDTDRGQEVPTAPRRRRRISQPVRRHVLQGVLAVADLVALACALVLAGLGRFLVTLPAWLILFKLGRLYDYGSEHAAAKELRRTVPVLTFGTWVLVAAGGVVAHRGPGIGPSLAFWVLALGLVPLARASALSLCRRSEAFAQDTVIVGTGPSAQLIARELLKRRNHGINVVGFVDSDPHPRHPELPERLSLLGDLTHLPALAEQFAVQRAILCEYDLPDGQVHEIVRQLHATGAQVDILPWLSPLPGSRGGLRFVGDTPLMELGVPRFTTMSRAVKRIVDVTGAVIGLCVTAPLFAWIGIRIRRDAGKPILERETRLGADMRAFSALRFRADPSTPSGRWLARTRMAGLPQLVNVLRGDLSLVGPRACSPSEVDNFTPHQFRRFLVPQGLTGLWQMGGRPARAIETIDLDVAYVEHRSLPLDLSLLLCTPFALLRRRADERGRSVA